MNQKDTITITSEDFRGEMISEELKQFQGNKILIKIESISTNNQKLLDQIALQIRNLSQISSLSLVFENNTILGEDNWTQIFSSVSFLTQLECLDICVESLCFLEDTGLNALVNALKPLKKITSLKLRIKNSNYITAICVQNLINTLQILHLLTTLELEIVEYKIDIGNNRINLWEGLSYLKNLQTLNLKLNLMYNHDEDIEQLLSTLLTYQYLTNLTLDFYYLQSQIDFIRTLTQNLSSLAQLKELSLELNKQDYGVEEIEQLSTFFVKLVNLEEINLNRILEKINQTHREIYYNCLSQLKHLKALKVAIVNDKNNSTSSVESAVSKCLQNQTTLQNLSIQIFGPNLHPRDQTLFQIAHSFQAVNKHLVSLELLFKANVSLKAYTSLSESFKYLVSLKQLQIKIYLDFDESGYSKQMKFLDGIGSIHSLESLKLEVNFTSFQDDNLDLMTFDFLKTLKLTTLDLSASKSLSIKEQISLGQGLQQQSELQTLTLELFGIISFLEEESAVVLSNGFKSLKSLKDLFLSVKFSANLQPELVNKIANSLNQLQQLKSFKFENLHSNSYDIVSQLTQSIVSSQDLHSFHLQNSRLLSLLGLQDTLSSLAMMNNLKQLFIQVNSPSYEQAQIGFDNTLSNLPNLEKFQCKMCFSDYGFFLLDVMRGLRYLKQLQTFILENKELSLTDKEAQEFNKSCSSLSNLRVFKFETKLLKDTFTSVGITHVYEGLSKLTRLQECKGLFFDTIFPYLSAFSGVFNLSHLQNVVFHLAEELPSYKSGLFGFGSQPLQFGQPLFGQYLFGQQPLFGQQSLFDQQPLFGQSNFQVNPVQPQQENNVIQPESEKEKDVIEPEKENDAIFFEKEVENFYKRNTEMNSNITYMKYFFQRIGDEKATSSISNFVSSLESLNRLNELEFSMYGSRLNPNCSKIMNSFLIALKSWNKLQKLKLVIGDCDLDLSILQSQNLQSLQWLDNLIIDLYHKKLFSDFLLFEQLQYFHQLRSLKIHTMVEISATDLKLLGVSLKGISKLQDLDLDFDKLCHTEEEPLIALAQGIGNQRYLQSLNLRFPCDFIIGEEAGIEMSKSVGKLQNLVSFQFQLNGDNKLSERSGAALASSLKHLSGLKTLLLNITEGNEQGQEFLEELSQSLFHLKHLTTTTIKICFGTIQQCPVILNEFLRNPHFSLIDLNIQRTRAGIQSTISVQSPSNKFVSLRFYSGQTDENQFLRIMLSSLQNLRLEQAILIGLNLPTPKSFDFSQVGQVIQSIKTQKITLSINIDNFSEELVNEVISPTARIESLNHYSITILLQNALPTTIYHQLADALKDIKANTLNLLFNDYTQQKQELQMYKLILKQLTNSAITSLTLFTHFNEGQKLKSLIKKLVQFSINGFL